MAGKGFVETILLLIRACPLVIYRCKIIIETVELLRCARMLLCGELFHPQRRGFSRAVVEKPFAERFPMGRVSKAIFLVSMVLRRTIPAKLARVCSRCGHSSGALLLNKQS
jgi:hypothetical protein